jgi:antagonist of KipI
MTGELEVVAPGLFTTVQDTRGRPEFQRYGVPVGGALDPFSAAAANALVGNPPEAAVLEITLAGPTLGFSAPTAFALAGADLGAVLNGVEPIGPGWSWLARPGSSLSFGERRSGARAYLAFGGGLEVPPVLGSRSADTRAGYPDLAGRPLRTGDRLRLGAVSDVVSRCGRSLALPFDAGAPVRVLPGPHLDRFAADALDAFCSAEWQIGEQADRMGSRLLGPSLRHAQAADVASLGLPVGAVQVPGDGRPIVLLADHQPTGGYTVLACVIHADLGLLAQRAPGEHVRFAQTTPEAARQALVAQHAQLQAVESEDPAWAIIRWAESGGGAAFGQVLVS